MEEDIPVVKEQCLEEVEEWSGVVRQALDLFSSLIVRYVSARHHPSRAYNDT